MRKLYCLIILLVQFCSLLPASEVHPPVPFALVDNFIYLKGAINELADLNLVFDTGSSANVIDRDLVRKIRLPSGKRLPTLGAGASRSFFFYPQSRMKIGPLLLKDFVMIGLSLQGIADKTGYRVDGLVGIPLARKMLISINYRENLIRFFHSNKNLDTSDYLSVKTAGYYHGIPLLEMNLRIADGRILPGRFLLDTGADIPLILFPAFIRKNRVMQGIGRHYPAYIYGLENSKNSVQVGRLPELSIARLKIENPPVYLPKNEAGIFAADSIDGIVGNEILKRFNIILHLQEDSVYLQANEMIKDPFKMDYSGLLLRIEGRSIKVHKVIRRSPAASSAIRPGDTITAVNGRTVEAADLLRVGSILSQPGARVRIQIRPRNTAEYRLITLRLRDQNL